MQSPQQLLLLRQLLRQRLILVLEIPEIVLQLVILLILDYSQISNTLILQLVHRLGLILLNLCQTLLLLHQHVQLLLQRFQFILLRYNSGLKLFTGWCRRCFQVAFLTQWSWVCFLRFVIVVLLSFVAFLGIAADFDLIYLLCFSVCSRVRPFILLVPIVPI